MQKLYSKNYLQYNNLIKIKVIIILTKLRTGSNSIILSKWFRFKAFLISMTGFDLQIPELKILGLLNFTKFIVLMLKH